MNSFNNKELTENKEFEKYESSTRTFLRMMWFLDYIFYFMSMFHDEPKAKASKIARYAYSKALAHNHDTLIQMAAKVAFSFVPNRHEFSVKLFSDPNYDPLKALQQVAFLLDLLSPFRNALWTFYDSKQLNKANLPWFNISLLMLNNLSSFIISNLYTFYYIKLFNLFFI